MGVASGILPFKTSVFCNIRQPFKMKKVLLLAFCTLLFGCFSKQIDVVATEELAKELYENTQISELDDCTRSQKRINGLNIELEPTFEASTNFYKEILRQEGITEETFHYFKNRLKETGLRHYYKKEAFSLFVTGGMMGEIDGILVSHESGTQPGQSFRLNGHYFIVIGSKIKENVFYFTGS